MALTLNEIKEVFVSWRQQAEDAGEQTFLLWNQLLNDLQMRDEWKLKRSKG